MSKKDKKTEDAEVKVEQQPEESSAKNQNSKAEKSESTKKEENVEPDFQKKYNEINDKYLRLSAEYDNYRKRSLKEKMELIKSAGEDILVNILPVMDDFERAFKSIEKSPKEEENAVLEGVELIYKRFKDFLAQRGVKEIEAIGKDFDTDRHEAVTKIPAPEKSMKGKVIDVIEKGYIMNEKVIRFPKVVIGE